MVEQLKQKAAASKEQKQQQLLEESKKIEIEKNLIEEATSK